MTRPSVVLLALLFSAVPARAQQIAAEYLAAERTYRSIAPQCPIHSACYLQNADYYHCLASSLQSGNTSRCTQPTCDYTNPPCPKPGADGRGSSSSGPTQSPVQRSFDNLRSAISSIENERAAREAAAAAARQRVDAAAQSLTAKWRAYAQQQKQMDSDPDVLSHEWLLSPEHSACSCSRIDAEGTVRLLENQKGGVVGNFHQRMNVQDDAENTRMAEHELTSFRAFKQRLAREEMDRREAIALQAQAPAMALRPVELAHYPKPISVDPRPRPVLVSRVVDEKTHDLLVWEPGAAPRAVGAPPMAWGASAHDATDYFFTAGRQLLRVPLSGATPPVALVTETRDIGSFTMTDRRVYFLRFDPTGEIAILAWVDKHGGPVGQITIPRMGVGLTGVADGLFGSTRDEDANPMFFTFDEATGRVRTFAKSHHAYMTTLGTPDSFFWLENPTSDLEMNDLWVAIRGAPPRRLVQALRDVSTLVYDDGYIYWATSTPDPTTKLPGPSTLHRVNVADGQSEVVLADVPGLSGFTVVDRAVVFAQSGDGKGRLMRASFDPPPPEPVVPPRPTKAARKKH